MYTPILATLGFILSPERDQVLLVHRNGRRDDHHYGKYNGLGGKLKPGEDIYQCLQREIHEEAGIESRGAVLRGTINWPGFGKKKENWFGFIFLVPGFSGQPQKANEEGDLEWRYIHELESLPMWEGDRYFLPLVFDDDPRIFHGCMPYKSGRPVGWTFSRV
ncbi:MAG: 8-oxo-dGTP diphosphatase [Desulfocapsaceae bacterium]|nr:8-oxo-dGTP diphosphatase [Desulfocapsaceae bacterium]